MKRFARCLAIAVFIFAAAWSYRSVPMRECAWCHRSHFVWLNRHHLIPQSQAPELANVETNIVVLCRTCHFVLGHRCDWRRSNPSLAELLARDAANPPTEGRAPSRPQR